MGVAKARRHMEFAIGATPAGEQRTIGIFDQALPLVGFVDVGRHVY
jgi:hypothetical protein